MAKKNIMLLIILGALLFLYNSPGIDQKIAKLPYDVTSNTFYGETNYIVWAIYFLVPVFTTIFIAIPILILGFEKLNSRFLKYRRAAIISLIALIIGPGLIINTVFKNNWGRPRPYQVLRDHKVFSPVWVPHKGYPENNSFCSGHAAIGFFLGVPFWALRRKKQAIVMSVLGGTVVGTVRILQGGHYFTDVIFAGIFVWLGVFLAVYLTDNIILRLFKLKED